MHKSPGGFLTRKGSTVRELSSPDLQRLFQLRGRSGLLGPDLRLVAGTGPNSLDSLLTHRFRGSRSAVWDEVQLQQLKILSQDQDGELRATVAGILLCTNRPDPHIRGAVIEAVRYDGIVHGNSEQLDQATITGPLDSQIRDAVHFVKRNTWVAARMVPDRVEIPQFHPRAVFEGIVNAVLHREYALENRKIRLFVFDDRLELYSPGTLANSLEIESMHRQQATRNETLASLLRSLSVEGIFGSGDRHRFLEDRGEGVPTIRERTRQLAGREPEFEVIGGNELLLRIPASPVPSGKLTGQVSVTASGAPLVGAQILVQHPDGTWHIERTDSFGRAAFSLHSDIPMTVLCAAPGHRTRAIRDWRPSREISIDIDPFPDGGSVVLMDGAGRVPNLRGRLNAILDELDRM